MTSRDTHVPPFRSVVLITRDSCFCKAGQICPASSSLAVLVRVDNFPPRFMMTQTPRKHGLRKWDRLGLSVCGSTGWENYLFVRPGLASWLAWPDGEIAEGGALRLAVHGFQA